MRDDLTSDVRDDEISEVPGPYHVNDDLARYDHAAGDEAVALFPAETRSASRLMVVRGGEVRFTAFTEILRLLPPEGVLILNESPVLNAELSAVTAESGHAVALNIISFAEDTEARDTARAFAFPGKRLAEGTVLCFSDGSRASVTVKREAEISLQLLPPTEGGFSALCARIGRPPLPPYIKKGRKRSGMEEEDASDPERYRAVYERAAEAGGGSCAAPTAGLHFTDALLAELQARGTELIRISLHVGAGTFLPVKHRDVTRHVMHEETYYVSEKAAEAITRAKREGRAVTCVGTTSLRALESAWDEQAQRVRHGRGKTSLFLRPGGPARVRAADALITNFHQPRSTLFMLVSALCGTERMRSAYAGALREGFRFYSYGDASLLIPAESLRKYPVRF